MARKPQEDKYKPRSDGRYYTHVSTGKYTDEGKPIRISLYANTSKDLEKKVNNTRYEIEHGTHADDKGISFEEYAKKWLKVSKATKSVPTQRMYEYILKNHIDVLGHKKLKNITKSDIQLQINKTLDKPRTCQQIRITIKQVMQSAVDDGLIIKNPCINIDLPRRVKKEQRALTVQEREALKKADLTPLEKAYLYIAYGCGIRPGELSALTRSDIDFTNNEITINKALTFSGIKTSVVYPKTNSGIRTIQTPKFVINAVTDYLKGVDGIILFPDAKGQYRTKSGYNNIFVQAYKKMKFVMKSEEAIHEAPISDLTMYIFRHNYCTELYYSGISLKEAQRLMGHSSYEMIMKVYSHLDEKKENTREKLEKLSL